MRVLFIRHAQAVEASDFSGPDLQRPLTGKGRRTMRDMAVHWAGGQDRPDHLLSSQAERARATADILAKAWGGMEVEERAELNPGAKPAAFYRVLEEAWKKRETRLVIVGHEPDLSTCVSALVAGGHLHLKFKKAACAEVELIGPRHGILRALIDPAWIVV